MSAVNKLNCVLSYCNLAVHICMPLSITTSRSFNLCSQLYFPGIHLPFSINFFAGLDSSSAYDLFTSLHNLAHSKRTIVLTIHRPGPELFDLFDKIVLLSDGKVRCVMFSAKPKHRKQIKNTKTAENCV